jgi:hypothetical protein
MSSDDVQLVSRKSGFLLMLGLGCVVASAGFSTMVNGATKVQQRSVKATKTSRPVQPEPLAPVKQTGAKVTLTDDQIGKWAALHLGVATSHSPEIKRLPLPLTADQTSCTVKRVRPVLTAVRSSQILKNPLSYAAESELRALARAAMSCGYANEAIFFKIERGQNVLFPEVKACFKKEFSSLPLFEKHLEMIVLQSAFDFDERLDTFKPLLRDQQRIAEICISEEQRAIFETSVKKTFNTISNTLPD